MAVISLFGIELTRYRIMRDIGRMAFPIFAFLLTEGFVHTSDRRRYGERLLAFALISEIPWNLLHAGTIFYFESHNVFFTLFMGYLGLCLLERLKDEDVPAARLAAGGLIALFVVAVVGNADYGPRGFGLVLVLYLLRGQPAPRAVLGSCVLNTPLFVSLAYLPIGMYNGQRGFVKGPVIKLLFYAIYPVHMLVLYYVRLRTLGY